MPAHQQQANHVEPVVVRLDHPALQHVDPSTAFLFRPHTVSALLLGLVLLAHRAGVFGGVDAGSQQTHDRSDAAAGVWAAIAVFLGYSVIQGPRTSMARPHPALWRLVHGCAVLYVLALVWLLFQSVHAARQALKVLDPSLGVEVAYRDYGTSCQLLLPREGAQQARTNTTSNSTSSSLLSSLLHPPFTVNWAVLRATLFDEFVVAHSLGWWAKALLLRNSGLLWVASIGFELLEASFAHMLPNFNECWWDSWLLDVAICNCLGIYAGMATVRWAECKYTNYNWQGWSELTGLRQRAQRSVEQLMPYSWTKLDWMASSSPKRCLQSALIVAAFLTVEVNVFFLKFSLWVPPTNPLNTLRLVLWLLVGAPAVREYYEFVQGSSGSQVVAGGYRFHKLGTFAWLALAMLSLETLLVVKFGRGLYPAPWPRAVIVSWALAGTAFAVLLLVWQWRLSRSRETSEREPPAASSRSGKGSKGL